MHTTHVYLGLMSGTSLDGVSAAVVRFSEGEDGLAHELIGFVSRPYNAAQRQRLLDAMHGGSADEYCRLNVSMGEWLADAAIAAIAESGVAREEIRAIGSHGQTLWHVPTVATWQVGEPAVIAERLGVDVVSNFRARDVAAGGHGAPLVPIADVMLYADAKRWRLLQNIGGMGNVTVVPPAGTRRGATFDGVRAFDTGPGVAVVDAVVRALYAPRTYDAGGAIAASGTIIESALEELLADPYFAEAPPKSTGRERFGNDYTIRMIERCRAHATNGPMRNADCVATAVALTARSIAAAYARFIPEPATEVIVSGGGAKNDTLVRALASTLSTAEPPRTVRRFDELYYDGEAKEAVAFALLAHLHVTRTPGNVSGATGACGPRVLGMLTPA